MTIVSKQIHAAAFTFLFTLAMSWFCSCRGMNTIAHHILCPDIEKQSLLSFKQSLQDPDSMLSSWDGGVDCCRWKGVVCDDFTGHVTQLRLHSGSLYVAGLSGKINPSLLNLTHLDLSQNSFGEAIPSFMGSLAGLEYLNLSDAGFHGRIPHTIGNPSNLRFLALGNYGADVDSLEWLSGLSKLEYLNMNNVDLSKATKWPQQKLDLSGNDLNGSLPTWMGTSLVNLRILILSSNKLSCNISQDICHLNSLQILDLSDNRISGVLPGCLSKFMAMATKRNLTDMRTFGPPQLDETVTIATKGRQLQYDAILPLVTHMDLSKNNLSGEIPMGLMSLVELRSLDLSGNSFTGSIPDRIGEMKQLESLDVSRNSLAGQIPDSFKLLYSLDYLNLSYNKLRGRIPTSTQLQSLDAWSFIGNDMCGPPLPRNCSHDSEDVHPQEEEKQGDQKSKISFALSMCIEPFL